MAHLLGGSSSVTGDWSSVIGIVTAIVGNILISFALNAQRYAHVRIDKEQQSAEAELSSPTESRGNIRSPRRDTLQEEQEVGEERRLANARSDVPRDRLSEDSFDDDADERAALLPRISSRASRKKELHRDDESDENNDDNDDESVKTVKAKKKSYLRSPYWWLGIALMVIGEAGNFLAYGFAPASIVSPLGVVALISNCLVAPCLLHEKFRRRDLLGVLIAVGGAVTVVVSAEGSNPKLGPDEILDLVKQWEFLTYMGITVGLIVVFMFLSNRIGQKTIIIDLGLVGMLGGYTALSTKGVASLLSYRLWFALTFPIFYVLILILVVTAVLQIKYVNRALQRFDSTRVIPTQFCSFTIFVIVGSAVLYRDFESATPDKVGTFVGGCLLTFLGVWFLTSARRDENNNDHDPQMPDEEQGIDLVDEDPQLSRSTTSTLEPSGNTRNADPATPTPNRDFRMSSSSLSTGRSFKSALSRPSDTPTPPPRLFATESSPLLPTVYNTASASSSANSLATETPSRNFHPSPHPDPTSTPLSTLRPRRRSLAKRASLNLDLAPGPFTSPLSGGLSVVVADQRGRMRRGSSLRESRAIPAPRLPPHPASLGRQAHIPAVLDGSGESGPVGVVAERPRMGRGHTAEVAPPVRDDEADASAAGVQRTGSGKGPAAPR